MHPAVVDFVTEHSTGRPVDLLDVGGRDINGKVAHLFPSAARTVVDLHDAPDVDIVGDICTLGLVEVADVVLCLEVLEHVENWRDIVTACANACRPGGLVLVTCAGPGRGEHSAIDGGPLRAGEWYGNITADELGDHMTECGLDGSARQVGDDTQAWGVMV